RRRVLELGGGAERVAAVAAMGAERLAGPGRELVERAGTADRAGEVEGKLAADDQLFEELAGDEAMPVGVVADGESDFEGGDVSGVEVGAQLGGSVGGWLVFLGGVAVEALREEAAEEAFGLGTAAG